MTAVRTLLCCGACVLVGCLFPSFDDLRNNDKKAAGADDASASSSSSSSAASSSGSTSTTSASSASSASSSASSGDGGSPGKDVPCEGPCAPPGKFCCTTIGGPSCQDPGTEGFCTGVEGGEIFRCDGEEDCEGGQVCCFTLANKEAKCAPTCAAQVLCNGPKATCPAGKACTALVESTFKACQ